MHRRWSGAHRLQGYRSRKLGRTVIDTLEFNQVMVGLF
jgi:hypothetical protein